MSNLKKSNSSQNPAKKWGKNLQNIYEHFIQFDKKNSLQVQVKDFQSMLTRMKEKFP